MEHNLSSMLTHLHVRSVLVCKQIQMLKSIEQCKEKDIKKSNGNLPLEAACIILVLHCSGAHPVEDILNSNRLTLSYIVLHIFNHTSCERTDWLFPRSVTENLLQFEENETWCLAE